MISVNVGLWCIDVAVLTSNVDSQMSSIAFQYVMTDVNIDRSLSCYKLAIR